MRTLTAKYMEEKLKRGYTLSYFSKAFDVSEAEFLQILDKTFSRKAYKGILARLKKNEKKQHSPHEQKQVDTPALKTEILVEETPTDISDEEVVVSEISLVSLEELEHQRDALTKELNELELKHKALVSDRCEIRNKISTYKEKLLSLKQTISEYRNSVIALSATLDEKYALMQDLDSKIADKRASLESIDSQISTLKKVVIWVYSSGEIDVDAPFAIDIDNQEGMIVNELITDELSGSLTVNQIKGIAKTISLVRFLKGQNLPYEIIWDDAVAEEIFNKKE